MSKMPTPIRPIQPPDCPEHNDLPTIDELTLQELDFLVMYRAIPSLDAARSAQGLEMIDACRAMLEAGYSGSEVFQSLITTLSDLIERR
jgi:hypothetical protein